MLTDILGPEEVGQKVGQYDFPDISVRKPPNDGASLDAISSNSDKNLFGYLRQTDRRTFRRRVIQYFPFLPL